LTACGGGDSSAPIAAQDAPDAALATAQALSGKAGKVVWMPGALELTALQGTSKSGSIALALGEAIQDPSLFVVPEIAGLIELSLRGRTFLGAGDSMTVPFLLSVSATTPPGMYEGTVHLRSGKRTIPATLKVRIQVLQPSSEQVVEDISDPSFDRIARLSAAQFLVKDEVLVELEPSVIDVPTRIAQIAKKFGAQITGRVPNTAAFQLRVPGADETTIEAFADAIGAEVGVYVALPSLLGRDLKVPDEGLYKGEWDVPELGKPLMAAGPNKHLEFIRAPEAWALTTGATRDEGAQLVAIIDKEFDYLHPDLVGNLDLGDRIKSDELFAYGWSTDGKRPGAAWDGAGHGTVVAGTLCAKGTDTGSGIGVVGVAWNCRMRLYPNKGNSLGIPGLRAKCMSIWSLDCTKLVSLPRTRDRMEHAVDDEVGIVNLSIAFIDTDCITNVTCSTSPKLRDLAKSVNKYLASAIRRDSKGQILWVIAAGNEARNAEVQAPASIALDFPHLKDRVLVVAGTDTGSAPVDTNQTVDLYRYCSDSSKTCVTNKTGIFGSNFGDVVDVAAPYEVSTTLPRFCTDPFKNICDPEPQKTATSTGFDATYYGTRVGGTSVSAPMVSGLAVLVRSQHKNKNLSAAAVKKCIVDASQHFGAQIQDPSDAARIHKFRVINAVEAVKCAPSGIPPSILVFNWTPRESPTSPTPKVVEGQTITFAVASQGSDPKTYQWTKNGAPAPGFSTGAEYTTPPATLLDDGAQYRVTISNAYGSTTSDPPLLLTVTPAPPPSEPRIGIVPTSLDFGGQQLGTPSAAKSFSITNTGSAPLIISSVTSEGANAGDFALAHQPCTQAPLAPAGSCSVSVVFTPSALGARSAVLSIVNNAAGAPHSAGLAGTGLDGPPPPPTPGDVQVLIDGLMWTDAIALDGEWVYFGTGTGAGVDNKWVLNRVSRDGSKTELSLATDPVGYPGTGFPRLYKIAFTATKVVVGAITRTGYTIWSVDKSDWQVKQIVTGVGPLFAAYGEYAYYGGDGLGNNHLFRINLDNPSDVQDVGGSYGYGQLLDPPFLYYGYGSGELSRFNLDTGVHTYIRSFGSTLYQATLSGDSDYIYYPQVACSNYGVIWRVSKTPPFATEVLLEGNPLTYPVAFGAAPAGQYVYYLENNIPCLSGQDLNLRAVSKVDRTVTPVLLSHIGGQYGLMSDGSAIYWYEGGNPSKIWKFPKSAK